MNLLGTLVFFQPVRNTRFSRFNSSLFCAVFIARAAKNPRLLRFDLGRDRRHLRGFFRFAVADLGRILRFVTRGGRTGSRE